MFRVRSLPNSALLGFLLSILPGCATYHWPGTQLETPEAVGPDRIGRLELASIHAGTDLVTPASPQATDPETGITPDPTLSMSLINYAFGVSIGVTPELDVGIKIEPYAPVLARAKYQFYGVPESKAEAGNLSVSGAASAGLLLSTYDGTGTTFYSGNASLIGGYRFAMRHIAFLSPFVSFAGLSGDPSISGSGFRMGAGLGYQYDIDALILRLELTYASGSFSQAGVASQAGGIFPGLLLGLKL